jgi:hypothetical protein
MGLFRCILMTILLGLMAITPARAELISFQLEPIIGYERVQLYLPTRHGVNRMIYGGRFSAGILLLSLESEFTRGEITETFPDSTIKTVGDRFRLGLRTGFRLGTLVSMFVRGGAQGSQEQQDTTTNGETVRTKSSLIVRPYGGAGARVALSSKIYASAGVVVAFPDFSDMSQNEYQATAGFVIKLP